MMKPEIIEYCAWDIALMPGLYNVYNTKLCLPGQAFWQAQVQEATKDRIKLSQSPGYDGQAESKVRGPWGDNHDIERAIDGWNEEVLHNALLDDEDNDVWNDDDYDDYCETARDCIGWEEDMIKNGEYFEDFSSTTT